MTEIALTELTTGHIDGEGVFDKLMAATKAHLESEFNKNRIKGPEYSTVYLGALDQVMMTAMSFVVQKRQIALQADLLAQQIILAGIEVQKAAIALEVLALEKIKVAAEIDQINAQVLISTQQRLNLIAEAAKTTAEILNVPKQGVLLDKQAAMVDQQLVNLVSENAGILAKNANTLSEGLNIPKTGEVLDAQVCKLQAEFDLTVNTNTKTTGEIALLAQKTASEKAQTMSMGVDDDSIIGRQKLLYKAQTDGFQRDAEQKAAKLLVDTWSARRMSDEGTVADGVNKLNDATVGRVVQKVLDGVNA
jgi:hypothetical protein